MKIILACLMSLLSCQVCSGQKNNSFNMVFGFGPSYFFNDNSLHRRVDNTKLIGINYILNNKKQNFSFNPALNYQVTNYGALITKEHYVEVRQSLFNLNLDVLLKAGKRTILRVGLVISRAHAVSVSSVTKDYNKGNYYYGSSELEKGYSPNNFQAGFTAGISIPFRLFKRDHKFNIKFIEMVSPVVTRDYYISKSLIGEDLKVLSIKARPSMLLIGFDLNFKRLKKKKPGEEE